MMDNFLISLQHKEYDPTISHYVGKHLNKDTNSRSLTGDHWNVFGPLQISFLKSVGLEKHHKLLDVGCGCFRGGIHIGEYLDKNNYYGLDINEHFIKNGYNDEIVRVNLNDKIPKHNIIITDHYDATPFNETFDFAWSLSLWTHLTITECKKCLIKVMEVLKPQGTYYTTFFLVDESDYAIRVNLKSELPEDKGILKSIPTFHNKDPYHMTLKQIEQLAESVGATFRIIRWNEWGMLRKHDIAVFTKK
jgi:cyclopropane fatty-acyl-phospholipid synthase-like methyltransferase